MSEGEWSAEHNVVKLNSVKGNYFASCGFHHPILRSTCLYPEEALYLVDRGALSVRVDGHILSISEAFAHFLTPSSPDRMPTLEHYLVYNHLKRQGYHVLRSSQVSHTESAPESDARPVRPTELPIVLPADCASLSKNAIYKRIDVN